MATILITIGFSVGFFAILFAAVGVRMLFLKNGEFRGTCASKNPMMQQEGLTCGTCGKTAGTCEQ